VHRAQPAEARPAGIEGEVGIGEKQSHPDSDEHADSRPRHRKHDADLARIVVVGIEAVGRRFGLGGGRDHGEDGGDGAGHDQEAVHAERIVLAGAGEDQADDRQEDEDHQRELALTSGKLCNHAVRPRDQTPEL
jgi:hypothetical protein